jgi:hypothetical protein
MDHLELIYCLDLHIVGSLNHVQKPFPSKLGMLFECLSSDL